MRAGAGSGVATGSEGAATDGAAAGAGVDAGEGHSATGWPTGCSVRTGVIAPGATAPAPVAERAGAGRIGVAAEDVRGDGTATGLGVGVGVDDASWAGDAAGGVIAAVTASGTDTDTEYGFGAGNSTTRTMETANAKADDSRNISTQRGKGFSNL